VGFDFVEGREGLGDRPRKFGRAFAAHAFVAQGGLGRCVRNGAGHAVVVPIEQIARGAGAFIERVGILHEGGIFWILREMFHGAIFGKARWSMQETAAKVVVMTTTYRNSFIGIAAYLMAVAALVAGIWWYGYGAGLAQLGKRAESDLALAANGLVGELERFRELAVLMADHPLVYAALETRNDEEAVTPVLQEIADKTGAIEIALVDASGKVLAATLGADESPLKGRAHFERALDGALGIDHLLRAGTGERIFVFAAPVFADDGPVVGAIVVSAGVEAVEVAWRAGAPVLFFTDGADMVFVASRSEMVLTSVKSGNFIDYDQRRVHGFDIWRVDGGRYLPRHALHLTQDLPVIAMRGEIMIDTAPARQLALLQAAAAGALCLAFGAFGFLATQRRRTLSEANAKLESRVKSRTAQLLEANTDLRREVAERRAAETSLKKAQADLVQAGKLSALGQMSAGISHELNQPLMAIQSFAENGVGFLERGKTEVAAQNLGRISELAHRMGRIIKNLRAFSRQEVEPFTDVDLGKVVDAMLELLEPKIAEAGIAVHWARGAQVIVRGGEVRLQQVLLNLASNAIDAMERSPQKILTIDVGRVGDKVVVSVSDTGPGIKEPEKIFDPFYSTKAVGAGEGMGLGLSISYGLVQSFGGAIRGRNLDEGGAIFTVELIPSAMEPRL
jgi:two-component system C4-dicarboxylate transport sensor histidine kinase DctB